MRSNSIWLPSLTALSLVFSVSLGCSDSGSTTDAGTDGGGGRGGAGGKDGGVDAAAGTSPDGSTVDAPDAPPSDAYNRDALLADISPDVVMTDGPESLLLSSPDLAAGAAFLSVNTCAGANTSPPLAWSAGPAGTMSYAVTLTDLSNAAVHWVIWDIPATTLSLPFGLPGDMALATPAGAKQVHKVEFFGAGGAYRGPCPNGANHVYQFEVNAIGTATLAGVGATPTTEGVKAAVQAVSLSHGTLEGTSNAIRPPVDAAGQ